MGNISIWQLLILLLVIVLIFGTKKLRSIGSDLGGAVKDFKKAVNDDEQINKKLAEQPASEVNTEAGDE